MNKQSFWLPLVAVFFLPFSSFGQFSDDEASAQLLAVQCTVSSGFAGGDYSDYGKRLAKTLSLLTAAEQERVFGFVPKPGDAGFAASLGASADVSSTSFAGGASASSGGVVADALASLGSMLIPDVEESPAIIAGVTAGSTADSPETTGSAGASATAGDTDTDAATIASTTNATTGATSAGSSTDASTGSAAGAGSGSTGSAASTTDPLLSVDLAAGTGGVDLGVTASLGSTSAALGAGVSTGSGDAWFDPLVGWLADEKEAEGLAGLAAGVLGGLTDAGVISAAGVSTKRDGETVDLAAAAGQIIAGGGLSSLDGTSADDGNNGLGDESDGVDESNPESGFLSGLGALFGGGDDD